VSCCSGLKGGQMKRLFVSTEKDSISEIVFVIVRILKRRRLSWAGDHPFRVE